MTVVKINLCISVTLIKKSYLQMHIWIYSHIFIYPQIKFLSVLSDIYITDRRGEMISFLDTS